MSAALFQLIPEKCDIDWTAIQEAFPAWVAMSQCGQDSGWHAEGDVWTHTRMVCEELVNLADYQAASSAEKRILFLTTLMHDIAKPLVTKTEDNGRISSKGHSAAGAVDARILLWRAGLDFNEREAVCRNIIYHQEPFITVAKRENPAFTVHKLSHILNVKHLALIAEADARGRRTNPESIWQETIDFVQLFRELAIEEQCYTGPYELPDKYIRFNYFRDDGKAPPLSRPAPAGSKATVLVGLPASGKNTLIKNHYAGMPVISLDDACAALGLKQGSKKSGEAVHFARDKAKEYLRSGQSFVWNSTHLTPLTRKKTIDLLLEYGADVELVYLEQTEAIIKSRNNKRDTTLTNKMIEGMLFNWTVPLPTEAPVVRYLPNLKERP